MSAVDENYLAEATPESWTEAGYLRAVARTVFPEDRNPDLRLAQKLTTAEGRRELTRDRFALFCLVYLRQAFTLKEGRKELLGQITVNDLTLQSWRTAHKWTEQPGHKTHREIWVAPRNIGKSTLVFLALPMWLAAHDRVKFVAAFADTDKQARDRLSAFRNQLRRNEALKTDYPALTTMATRGSHKEAERASKLKSESGFTMFVAGAGSSFVGLLEDDIRPDLILLDDLEQSGESWSKTNAEGRLKTLRESILYLSTFARVIYSGTTTAYGSLIHQALTQPDLWADAENFVTKHIKPVVTESNGGDVKRRTCWPARWTVEELDYEQKVAPRVYAINMSNDPMSAGEGAWWSPEMFHVGRLRTVTYRLISIDPGVSTKPTSDPSGVSVISLSVAESKVCVEEAFEVKAKAHELKLVVLRLLNKYPDVRCIVWESPQGGTNYAYAVLGEIPPVPIHFVHPHQAKIDRADLLLTRYAKGQVIHGKDLMEYKQQLLSFPNPTRSPNLVDSVGMGIEYIASVRPPQKRSGPSIQVVG